MLEQIGALAVPTVNLNSRMSGLIIVPERAGGNELKTQCCWWSPRSYTTTVSCVCAAVSRNYESYRAWLQFFTTNNYASILHSPPFFSFPPLLPPSTNPSPCILMRTANFTSVLCSHWKPRDIPFKDFTRITLFNKLAVEVRLRKDANKFHSDWLFFKLPKLLLK